MGDQRNLTMGVSFGLLEAISQLETVYSSIQDIKAEIQGIEAYGTQMGSEIARNAGVMADELENANRVSDGVASSMENLADAGAEARDSIRESRQEVEEMGAAAKKSSDQAQKGFQNASDAAEEFGSQAAGSMEHAGSEARTMMGTIKAGIQTAFGIGQKRVTDFTKKAVGGAKTVNQAFTHPIQTIRSKLPEALKRVQEWIQETGEEASRTDDDLDKMGGSGADAGSRISEAMGSAVKSFLAVSVAVEAVKKGIDLAKQFGAAILEAGKTSEQVGVKFKAAFSEDSGVSEWADNFAEAVHRSETEVQGFLVSNKAMYNELGITGEAATDLSKITTSLAYDLGSAFKMDDSEALGTLQDYINGNTKAFDEYGIQIDDAILKQSAMELGLGKNIDSLDDAAMAQVRMNALLKNSTEIQKMAAEKQEGYTNGIKSLSGVWQDFLSNSAERFEPVFTNLVNTVLTSWPQVEPVLMGMVDALSNGIAAGAPIMMDLAQNVIPPLMSTLGELGVAVEPLGKIFLSFATTVLPPVAKIIGSMATTVVPPLVDILNELNEGVIVPLMPYVESIANAILPALGAELKVIPQILRIISPVLGGIADILSRVVGFLSKIVEWAGNGLAGILDKVAGFFGGGSSAAKNAGADIPHNADGDPDFKGGWTHINEQGGEIAYLPSGSTIIPADKSDQIINNSRQNNVQKDINFNPVIKVEVHGGGGESGTKWTDDLKQMVKELYEEMQADEYNQLDIQLGNV